MKNYIPFFAPHGLPRFLLLSVALLSIGLLIQSNPRSVHASGLGYYVSSTGGFDGNAGTFDAPFATIQKCAEIAQAGDTCTIRGGTYRETVTPRNSGTQDNPITFVAYNNEQVTVNGTDVLGGWSNDQGSIYKAEQAWDLGLGSNQVFVDHALVYEARWPNIGAGADISHPTLAFIESGSFSGNGSAASGTINDTHLPAGLEGAKINAAIALNWVAETGAVTSSSTGHLTFSYNRYDDYVQPAANQSYFVWGKRSLLDTSNESFYDSASHQLYLWTPQSDDPNAHLVEVKRRQQAFDLRGRSFITLKNIGLFAANVLTDTNSQNNVLDGLQAAYLTHELNITTSGWLFHMYDSGIVLTGSNNTLTNSTIAYSSANGVSVSGTGQHVINNIIHDVDYAATDASTVTTGTSDANATGGTKVVSKDHEISYNSLYNSGRSVLVHRGSTNLQITHNDMHDAGLQVTDLGMTYTFGSDGGGTVIAYNLVHDNHSTGFNVGIYVDNGSQNYIVHHNVVWNVGSALVLNTPSYNNKAYNNTLLGSKESVSAWPEGKDMAGTELKNNIFTNQVVGLSSEVVQQNNITQGTDPRFTAASSYDYTLQSNSPALDAGQVLAPYTDGYNGSAPDAGAYEFGVQKWTAGSNIAATTRSATSIIQAESYDAQNGVTNYGTTIGSLDNGDWTLYRNVDFGAGVNQFQANVAVPPEYAGQKIEVHIDSLTGPLVGALIVQSTGDWNTLVLQSADISTTTGKHDLYLVFVGSYGVGNLDWFRFAAR